MDLWNTPERQALRETVTRFTEREIVPHLPQWEDEGQLPRSLSKAAAAAGILGVGFAEEVGGEGGDAIDTAVVTEAIIEAGGSAGVIASLFTHGIAVPHIIDSGNPDLIDRFVRPTLAGELIGSLGVTEPDGGSDVANITTRAVRDGDHYVVNGAKTFITSAVRGDFVTTAVRTGEPGFGGISLLVVEKGTPGFEVARPLRKMGWHCSDTAELSFTDVRVPVANLVGEENGGFVLLMQQFVNERLGLALQGYATAQRALDLAVRYAKERETFGKPLASRQVIRHKLVEMHRRTSAARTVTRAAIEKSLARSVTDPDVILDALMAKNTAVETVEWVVSEAVQIHGGAGYMRDSEIDRHYRDARIIGIGGGATEVLTDLAAKLLGY
ncbi:acyl-CoA dehydrogenase family protein [Nocardioides daeguensis]|uniref:Acyl-CoA dehydrogenase family protein n=1 Tax=Nocardioides daeguensis TaxID=908359 RepID=A0ABP6VDI3_9ACTN|nr:acyl-CoA dehydrogenase family protein [Nocardioides daeguensis]MBV6729537.1 acyl-CoA dehydrogenase family protein [Nocardioides daeguensis]MCR1771690.1 acyl-CoA dehydrogenase family protein [Nocardioides daeguensis]